MIQHTSSFPTKTIKVSLVQLWEKMLSLKSAMIIILLMEKELQVKSDVGHKLYFQTDVGQTL